MTDLEGVPNSPPGETSGRGAGARLDRVDSLWDWYFVGVAVGLGVTAGIPGLPREQGRELAVGVATVVAVAAGVIAALVTLWAVLGTLLGLAIGVFSFRRLAAAAIPAATLAAGLIALVPFLGYLEALLAPVLGARLRRRADARYAGLRILAKD